jgi:hypothetical protein
VSYEDILDQCLAAVRRGEDVEPLIATQPQFAERLRLDLAAAASARRLAGDLPLPSPAARQAFRASLASQREQRAAQQNRSFWPMFRVPALALGAVSVVVVIVGVVLAAGLLSSNTAEASSIEGVVVQNDNGALMVQTEGDVQTIEVQDSLTVSDDSGASVDLASIEPGQLVVIRGKPGGARVFRARRIELRAADQLRPWCRQHLVACAALDRTISQRAAECTSDQPICQNIRSRLDQIRQELGAGSRLQQLQSSCDAGTRVDCREIVSFCNNNPGVCDSIRDWLRARRLQ